MLRYEVITYSTGVRGGFMQRIYGDCVPKGLYYANYGCYYTSVAPDAGQELPKVQRIARVARTFTPGAPIDSLELFAGRDIQVQDVISAITQRGYHVGLYGERGVGKTSLASVLAEIFAQPDFPRFQSVLATCNTESSFESIWRDIFRSLGIAHEGEHRLSPEDVRYEIGRLESPALIVIDELDRLEDDASLTLLADTLKAFSDHVVASTVVLVGVADSIGELIGEHESIVRNLQQVEVPRMSAQELGNLLDNGCRRCELLLESGAREKIVGLSEGLPHYTHLLALNAGLRAIQDDRQEITLADVDAAIPLAVARHTIASDYLRATASARSDNLYRHVLLACALAHKNQLGYFTAGAIRAPLRVIAGRRLEIPAFARHLNGFLTPERGAVLHRQGEQRNYRYRFSDPLMQPYVVLRGLSDDLVTSQQVFAFQGPMLSAGGDGEKLF
jgi:Cdc6-like AAA superfamily ATPase